MDVTQTEESTDGRLLELEKLYSEHVRIFVSGLWEVTVRAHGRELTVSLVKEINGDLFKLSQEEIEHHIDLAIEECRIVAEIQREWDDWCKSQGLKRW